MTEREYVEHIRKTAEAYMDSFGPQSLDYASRTRWQTVKTNLSPETAIGLCEAWLAADAEKARTAPLVKTATGVAGTSE